MKRILALMLLVTVVLSLPAAMTSHLSTVCEAQAYDVFDPLSCVTWEREGGAAWLRMCLNDLERAQDPYYEW